MTTKVELVNSAYSQLRISGLTINPTPEDTETALWRLEDMMSEFWGRTLDFNYQFEETPLGATESGVDRTHHLMISSNLAMELLDDFGKDAPLSLSSRARSSFSSSSAVLARERLNTVKYPTRMPIGSGNSRFGNRYRRFFPKDAPPVTDAGNEIVFCGEINDYQALFNGWLRGEEIDSYSIDVGAGMSLVTGIVDPAAPASIPTASADPNFATACGAGNWVCTGGTVNFVIAANEAVVATTDPARLTNSSFVWDATKSYTVTIQYDDTTKSYAYGQILCGNETAFGEAGNIQVDDAPDGSLDRVTGIQTVVVTGVSGTGFVYHNNTEINDSIANTIVELSIVEVTADPVSDYESDGIVHYRLQADACPYAGDVCVKVTATSTTGRVETRERLFTVERKC